MMIMMMKYFYTNTAKQERQERGKGEQKEGGEDEAQSLKQASSETATNMKR